MITKMGKEAKEFFIEEIKKGKVYICPLGDANIIITKAIHQVTPENPWGKPKNKLTKRAIGKALLATTLLLLFSYER